jgi:hypothetical protein
VHRRERCFYSNATAAPPVVVEVVVVVHVVEGCRLIVVWSCRWLLHVVYDRRPFLSPAPRFAELCDPEAVDVES